MKRSRTLGMNPNDGEIIIHFQFSALNERAMTKFEFQPFSAKGNGTQIF